MLSYLFKYHSDLDIFELIEEKLCKLGTSSYLIFRKNIEDDVQLESKKDCIKDLDVQIRSVYDSKYISEVIGEIVQKQKCICKGCNVITNITYYNKEDDTLYEYLVILCDEFRFTELGELFTRASLMTGVKVTYVKDEVNRCQGVCIKFDSKNQEEKLCMFVSYKSMFSAIFYLETNPVNIINKHLVKFQNLSDILKLILSINILGTEKIIMELQDMKEGIYV